MNSALNSYSAQQHRADLVREARRAELRPPKPKVEAVEPPRRVRFRLVHASRSAA